MRSGSADVEAVVRRREIFLDGKISKATLKTDMTLDRRRRKPGNVADLCTGGHKLWLDNKM